MRYFILEKIRLDSIGSPFRNVNSGVNEEEDPVNIERYEKGINLYVEEFKSKAELNRKQEPPGQSAREKCEVFVSVWLFLCLSRSDPQLH